MKNIFTILTVPVKGQRKRGQALVELAIAASLLAFLFMGAVDAGLAYKTYQTLVNASAEASGFLAQRPYVGPPPAATAKLQADTVAIAAFKQEQNGSREGTNGSTATIDIKEADDDQIVVGAGGVYGVADSFTGANSTACRQRQNFDANGKPCYIVVRTSVVYRPFMLTPFFGSQLKISTVSIKPIVGYPVTATQ